ncbi:hypothetical protein HN51_045939 [Arachis hypogaea]
MRRWSRLSARRGCVGAHGWAEAKPSSVYEGRRHWSARYRCWWRLGSACVRRGEARFLVRKSPVASLQRWSRCPPALHLGHWNK